MLLCRVESVPQMRETRSDYLIETSCRESWRTWQLRKKE